MTNLGTGSNAVKSNGIKRAGSSVSAYTFDSGLSISPYNSAGHSHVFHGQVRLPPLKVKQAKVRSKSCDLVSHGWTTPARPSARLERVLQDVSLGITMRLLYDGVRVAKVALHKCAHINTNSMAAQLWHKMTSRIHSRGATRERGKEGTRRFYHAVAVGRSMGRVGRGRG